MPADQIDAVLAKARAANIGYVWMTDEPYTDDGQTHILPSYWAAINQQLSAGC